MNTDVSINVGNLIAGGFVTGILTLFFFFVRSYFARLSSDVSSIKGSIDIMRRDLHDTREEMIVSRSELKALWRAVDGPLRASDQKESLNGR